MMKMSTNPRRVLTMATLDWMQGDPGPRLLQVAGLLTAAARMSSSAAVAALAASVINGIMFTSVCRGFISGQGHSPDASPSDAHGTTEVQHFHKMHS